MTARKTALQYQLGSNKREEIEEMKPCQQRK
jgi:hypothetical protein